MSESGNPATTSDTKPGLDSDSERSGSLTLEDPEPNLERYDSAPEPSSSRARQKPRIFGFLRSKSRRRGPSDESTSAEETTGAVYKLSEDSGFETKLHRSGYTEAPASDEGGAKFDSSSNSGEQKYGHASHIPTEATRKAGDVGSKVEAKENSKRRFPKLRRLRLWPAKRNLEVKIDAKDDVQLAGDSNVAEASGSQNPYEVAAASLQSVVLPPRPRAKSLMPLEVNWGEDDEESYKAEKNAIQARAGSDTPEQAFVKCWMGAKMHAPSILMERKGRFSGHPNVPRFSLAPRKSSITEPRREVGKKAGMSSGNKRSNLASTSTSSLVIEELSTCIREKQEPDTLVLDLVEVSGGKESRGVDSEAEKEVTDYSVKSKAETVRPGSNHASSSMEDIGIQLRRLDSGEVIDVYPAEVVASNSEDDDEDIPIAEVVVRSNTKSHSGNLGVYEHIERISKTQIYASEPRTPQSRSSRRVSFSDLVEMVTFNTTDLSYAEASPEAAVASIPVARTSRQGSLSSSFEFNTGIHQEKSSWDAAVRQISFILGSNVTIRVPTDLNVASPLEKGSEKGGQIAGPSNSNLGDSSGTFINRTDDEDDDEDDFDDSELKITPLYRSFSMPEAPLRAQAILAAEKLERVFAGDDFESVEGLETSSIGLRGGIPSWDDSGEEEEDKRQTLSSEGLNFSLGNIAMFHTVPVVVASGKKSSAEKGKSSRI